MEPKPKVDIKSEIYHAAVPHITRLVQVAYARYRVLPKGDIFKNFVILYVAVGFITEGLAGALPNMALGMLGISTGVVGWGFFIAWPIAAVFMGEGEHAFLSLSILFIGATYVTHLKQKNVEAFAIVQSFQGAQPRAALTEDRSFAPQIDMEAEPVENPR